MSFVTLYEIIVTHFLLHILGKLWAFWSSSETPRHPKTECGTEFSIVLNHLIQTMSKKRGKDNLGLKQRHSVIRDKTRKATAERDRLDTETSVKHGIFMDNCCTQCPNKRREGLGGHALEDHEGYWCSSPKCFKKLKIKCPTCQKTCKTCYICKTCVGDNDVFTELVKKSPAKSSHRRASASKSTSSRGGSTR